MSGDNKTENEIVANLALAAGEYHMLDEKHPYVILDEGWRLESLDYLRDTPARIKAKPCFRSLGSLIEYINKFKNPSTAIFCAQDKMIIETVIDYHRMDYRPEPSWCEHRAFYRLMYSRQWKTWSGGDRIWVSQELFANFIENNLADIAVPSGAELMEIASSLEAKKSTDFKSAIRLKDGTSELFFNDTLHTTVAVPDKITLGISPFEHSPPYQLSARLRYRIRENKLEFCYILENPEKIVEGVFNFIIENLLENTGIKPYLGTVD